MRFIEAPDGTKLYSREWGAGPAIVLVHGWPLDADMWEYQAVPLAKAGFRVIAYDRRGFGRSDQPWTGYDYDTLADDLKAVMDAYAVQDGLLVGFSMGGGEVARYMSRHGGAGLSKAALVAAVTPFLLKTDDNPDGLDRSVFDGMVEGIEKDRPHFLAEFGKKFYGVGLLSSPVSAEILQWSLSVAMLGSPKATVDCVRSFSETDFRPDLAEFHVPTLVIHGSADQTVPIGKSAEKAVKLLPDAKLVVYNGHPHGLQMTAKDRLVDDLAAFARGGLSAVT